MRPFLIHDSCSIHIISIPLSQQTIHLNSVQALKHSDGINKFRHYQVKKQHLSIHQYVNHQECSIPGCKSSFHLCNIYPNTLRLLVLLEEPSSKFFSTRRSSTSQSSPAPIPSPPSQTRSRQSPSTTPRLRLSLPPSKGKMPSSQQSEPKDCSAKAFSLTQLSQQEFSVSFPQNSVQILATRKLLLLLSLATSSQRETISRKRLLPVLIFLTPL